MGVILMSVSYVVPDYKVSFSYAGTVTVKKLNIDKTVQKQYDILTNRDVR